MRELLGRQKKRGEYIKLTQNEKAAIGRYTSEHGITKAVRHYKEKDVKETSVWDWKNLYEKELKDKCALAAARETVVVAMLTAKQHRRPPLLGEKLDGYLQQLITSM